MVHRSRILLIVLALTLGLFGLSAIAIGIPPGSIVSSPGAIGDVNSVVDRVPEGTPVIVSLGDSFISGEGGRWRGNVWVGSSYPKADALGPTAYWDTDTGESITGCHRAKGAAIHLPGEIAVNLACSGAIAVTRWAGRQYKPGLDWGTTDSITGARLLGQLTLLDRLARHASVRLVVLSVGGNDMGFPEIVRTCIVAFAKPWPVASRCRHSAPVRRRLSDANLAAVGAKVQSAIERVHATMQAAGYANGQWSTIVQTYPRVIAEKNRYPETYSGRFYSGGCPFYDADVRWIDSRIAVLAVAITTAAQRAAATSGQPVQVMDLTHVFAGRELCAKGARHVDRISIGQIVAKAERVNMVRASSPFTTDESLHPNHLGQQALQACLAAAWVGGTARSGRCDAPADWAQVDANGLPRVRFITTD